MNYDAVIIGAGVIGGMLARNLSRYELRVCLLEKGNDVAVGASKANSGIVHGGYDPKPGTLKAKLDSAGAEKLFATASELNVPFRRNGSMVCAFSEEEEKTLDKLLAQGRANGITGLAVLSGDEARKLEPNLSETVTKVLHVKNAGIVSPYELTIAAVGNAMDNGVELKRNFEVAAIERDNRGFTVTSTDGKTVYGRYLINCAGGYSDRIAAMVGDDYGSIIPRAGEYLLLDQAEGKRVSHTLFQCPTVEGKGVLVIPTVHGNLLLGPTAARVADPGRTETTSEGLAWVERMARKTVPSVDLRQVITAFTGVRASHSGGDFILEASKNNPGMIHAIAIDSPGLTSCVSIAEYLTELLRNCGLTLKEKDAWTPTREKICAVREMTEEEWDAHIKQDPAYGRIVCRCETVSEAEIIQAIRMNPGARDVDGVKRRTRSGMGRCQGGFCGPSVMKLLSEQLGVREEEVTKKGKGSELVTGLRGKEK